jgi:5'-nucleotidase
MKVLLTNDDGIHAPGIEALYMALADPTGQYGGPLADVVWPVAPLTVQSATSHGITFHTPLMVGEQTVSPTMSGVSVDGRPADCVKLAICSLWPERFGAGTRPDLVVSGMNAGANIGINVIYSGTVAAALEAAFLGVPSIAVSLHLGRGHTRFDVAARHARRAIERVLAAGIGDSPGGLLGRHACVSINVPICEDEPAVGAAIPPSQARRPVGSRMRNTSEDPDGSTPGPRTPEHPSIVVCPMNTHGLNDNYERRTSPGGDVYYWASGGGLDFRGADPGTDVEAIYRRHIVVTPLKYDLTDHNALGAWRRSLGEH